MKTNEFLEFSTKYEGFREDLQDAILSEVVVTVSDERGILWQCSNDKWNDKRFENWTVKQELDIDDILKKVLPAFVDLYEKFKLTK